MNEYNESQRCLKNSPGYTASGKNKYYQRMMVDPMFMIVQNLWLFRSDVTPTAVTPTAVILRRNFG